MARFKATGPSNKAPQRIQNIERMMYVKALRLANGEPTETAELQYLHAQLVRWMTNTEKIREGSKAQAADIRPKSLVRD